MKVSFTPSRPKEVTFREMPDGRYGQVVQAPASGSSVIGKIVVRSGYRVVRLDNPAAYFPLDATLDHAYYVRLFENGEVITINTGDE